MPLTNRFIPVECLTTHHYIFGQLRVIQSGLMGMMSDVNSSTLEMTEASLAQIYKPDKVVSYTPLLYMVRSRVVVVSLGKRDYLGVQGMMRSGYQRLYPYQVQITTNDFLMINNASLSSPLFPALHLEAPVMLLNRCYLETLLLLPKTEG
jgi:hypothetical protein